MYTEETNFVSYFRIEEQDRTVRETRRGGRSGVEDSRGVLVGTVHPEGVPKPSVTTVPPSLDTDLDKKGSTTSVSTKET